MSGIPRNSERDWSLYFFVLHRIDQLAFRLLTYNVVVLFIFHQSKFMERQQKLSLFFAQKRMAVEAENQEDGLDKDGEAGEVSLMLSQPLKLEEPMASSSASNTVRKFL